MKPLLTLCMIALTGCVQMQPNDLFSRASAPVSVQASAQDAYVNGNLALRRDDLDTAIAAYRKALAETPNLFEARYNLGIALLKQAHSEFLLYAGLAPNTAALEPIAPMLRCLEAYVGQGAPGVCDAAR